jgi:hypothetical protein
MSNSGTPEVLAHIRQLRKLTCENMAAYYDEWREEVEGLLLVAGLGNEIYDGGQDGTHEDSYKARGIILLCLSHDTRDKVRREEEVPLDAFDFWQYIHYVAHRVRVRICALLFDVRY